MFQVLANPQKFMAFSKWAAPIIGAFAVILLAVGLWLGFHVPDDYQQGRTVRLLFIHPQIAILSMFAYACLGGAAFFGVVFRHALADAAARAAAPLGAAYTLLALVTGSFWGRPMWGAWWAWDARLTSELVLLLLFLGYMGLVASIDDEAKANRAGGILAMVGLINLPIIHYSVNWWNTLHQGPSDFANDLAPIYALPFVLNLLGFMAMFGSLWLVRTRAEVWRRRAQALAVRRAGRA
ncbi:MAG TPA: heme ABC transporter permease CcmC [Caulobacteraceae bacterium]|nr:heme ABC transporter permease CcmC [Caulobacteraceae bacterium]